jgi:hypothetical protein
VEEMKYLNTKYGNLFDSNYRVSTSGNYIFFSSSNNPCYVSKTIPSLSKINISFFRDSSNTLSATTYSRFLRVSLSNFSIGFSIISTNYLEIEKITTSTTSKLATNIPISGSVSTVHGDRYVSRYIYVSIDIDNNLISVYSNSQKVIDVTLDMSGNTINNVRIGNDNSNFTNSADSYINNVIISDDDFPLNERVTEATPTISSTDWTVTSGVASTDVLGGTMTITSPNNAIDETKRVATGYAIGYINSTPSATINAIEVTQGSSTSQTVLLDSMSCESDVFNITQLSDISATAVASYVTQ